MGLLLVKFCKEIEKNVLISEKYQENIKEYNQNITEITPITLKDDSTFQILDYNIIKDKMTKYFYKYNNTQNNNSKKTIYKNVNFLF